MASEVLLQWSGATDVGRVRSNNQDRYYADPNNGIWVVADGMGGHQGGETASLTACDALAEGFTRDDEGHASAEGLVEAIQDANRAVHDKGNDDPDLTGMGTTVVALAVVGDDNGDEVFAIAHVGDSRAYRFSDGVFEQVTEDHSLVAEMVREGSLSAEDAATHPQRNILTRVLGVYEEVPVDVITVIPHPGDRFVLCSDGLFNEVSDDGITAVLRRLVDPAEAADELVRLAVHAGGRDNVTVVVVDVLEDGDRAGLASQALAGDHHDDDRDRDTASLSPYGGAYNPDTMTEESGATTRARRARHRRRRPAGDAQHAAPRRPRRLTWRVLLFTLLVLALIGGVFATIQWYAMAAYYVGFDGDEVAIFQGRPGGVAWIDPELEQSTDLARDELPDDVILALESGKEESSLTGARRFVATLEDRVAELEGASDDDEPATTTTTTTTSVITTTRPPTTPNSLAPPPA